MPGANRLRRLSFAAARRAPHNPFGFIANRIARAPKVWRDAGINRIFQEARFPAAFDFPREFRAKLKIQAFVVNAPRAIRVEINSVIGVGDELIEFPRPRQQIDIRHANQRRAIPIFRAHRPI